MKAGRKCPPSAPALRVLFASLFSLTASMAGAQDYEDFILSGRDYKLQSVGSSSPSRVMDFRFNAQSTFTEHPATRVYGACLCITGVFTGKYPTLGTQLTWYTPTSTCAEGSEAFQKEAELAASFLEMTQLESAGATLRFSSQAAQTMVFEIRRDMKSCLKWFEHKGALAAQNACTDPVQVQVYAPRVDQTVGVTVPASGAELAGISRNDAEDFLYAACPVDTQPTVPFNKEGFPLIRAREYECR